MIFKFLKFFKFFLIISIIPSFFYGFSNEVNAEKDLKLIKESSITKKNQDETKSKSSKYLNSLEIKRKGYVNINGPKISIVFNNIEAKEALLALTKLGNYGFIFVPNYEDSNKNKDKSQSKLVTVSFKNEDYEKVINSILMSSGLQGKREGNILFVGENVLNKGFESEISRIFKMDNTSAASAADYLASLGAVINKVSLSEAGTKNDPKFEASFNQDSSFSSYGSNQGPLKGLKGTSDTRLETITLIGKMDLLDLAERYLEQIDKVQKQVALSVKILDVNLNNEDDLQNSFAASLSNPTAYILNDEGDFDFAVGDISSWRTSRLKGVSNLGLNSASKFDFLNWLNGKISSSETKVLASPTLILSESRDQITGGQNVSGSGDGFSTSSIGRPYGNESFITVGTKVITNYTVTPGENGGPAACEATFGNAGLTFGAKLHKINSNNDITFSLSPELSSITSTMDIGTCGLVNVLSIRRLDTGTIKVGNGKTLALTGVISDTDSEIISKWPIFGDLPLLGNLFKSKSKGIKKSELVILVTPNIIGQDYSYNYKFSKTEELNLEE